MKNNKGFTIIELIVSFVLSMIIVVILFQLIINLKEIYSSSGIKTEMLNKQNIMTDKIYTDLTSKQVISVSRCSEQTTCLNFQYANGKIKQLIVNETEKTLSYDNYTIKLNKNFNFKDISIKTETTELQNTYNGILEINIPIYNDLFKDTNFGLNIVYIYNNSQNIEV